MKRLISALLCAALLPVCAVTVGASSPERAYTETYWDTDVAAPSSYEAVSRVNGGALGTSALNEPQDISADAGGNLYIADTGNNRVLVLDSGMKLVREISKVKKDGVTSVLAGPVGVFARDGFLYIADTQNERVIKIDGDNNITASYTMPAASEYTLEFFHPTHVAVDNDGMVFVLVEGVYQGFLLYDNGGTFQSFYGSARVQATFKVVMDRLWKRLLTRRQRSSMANYVPTEYSNLTVDSKGFIYACCLNTDTNSEQIRKLNYLGNNIFPFTDNFGETNSTYYKRNSIVTTFIDIAVSDGIVYGLDSARNRVYAFDGEGNRLFTFGCPGEMTGAFRQASSIAVSGQTVYVLDRQSGEITAFSPTAYGALILSAISDYSEGRFTEARETWETLLKHNINLELAYSGMGEALLKSGEYRKAMEYFRRGNNPERESAAFIKYRAQIIRDNPIPVTLFLLLVLTAVLMMTSRAFWRRVRAGKKAVAEKRRGRAGELLHTCIEVLAHPVSTMTERKYKRFYSWGLVGTVLVWWFLLRIAMREWTGFRFRSGDGELNIFLELLFSIAPFILFCLANWACCSIQDGEGRFSEICTFTALAMLPYLLVQTAAIPLSNFLSLAEQDFFNWFLLFGTLWTAFLIFQAVRITHQYSSGKTILVIALSVAGIVIILFLLLLIVALVQQMYSFIVTLISELSYNG